MRATDSEVGVSEFISSHTPFSAVVKAHFSDFVVNELTRDGTVVRLTSTALPEVSPEAGAAGAGATQVDEPLLKPPENEADWDTVCVALDKHLSDDGSVSSKIRSFATAGTTEGSKDLVLPPIAEKESRKAVHDWVKRVLPGYVTETMNSEADKGCIRLLRASDANFQPRSGKRKRGADDPHFVDRRAYVQFVLWKQGRDTVNALSDLANRLRIRTDDLSHAGTKDKRGVTTQRIRVRGVPLRKLVQVNRSYSNYKGLQRMAIGNYEILSGRLSKPLGLGDLGGNRFTLALRELDLSDPNAEENIMRAVVSVRDFGFVNYFGLQRFGSGSFGTHMVGFCVLRGDFKEACRLLLTPVVIPGVAEGKEQLREDRRKSDQGLRDFEKGSISAKELLDILPRWMSVERCVASGFASDEARDAKHDPKAAFSRLPRTMKKMYGHAVQSYIWNFMASARMRQSKAEHAIEGDLILAGMDAESNSLGTAERRREASLNASTEVRPVTAEEAENKSIPISEVLLPVPGSKVLVSAGVAGDVAREILEREKVDLQTLPQEHDMVGTYRWLVARPADVTAKIVRYSNRSDRIIPPEVADVGDHPGRDKAVGDSKGADPEGTTSPSAGTELQPPKLAALVLSFSLSVAEYATILIRELTKHDSSVESQKMQQQSAIERGRKVEEEDAANRNTVPSSEKASAEVSPT